MFTITPFAALPASTAKHWRTAERIAQDLANQSGDKVAVMNERTSDGHFVFPEPKSIWNDPYFRKALKGL